MNKNQILNKVINGKLNIDRAYDLLYGKEEKKNQKGLKKAKFIKIRFDFSEGKSISKFLNFLFLCPMPIFILNVLSKNALSKHDVINQILFKGISISIINKDMTLKIKTL